MISRTFTISNPHGFHVRPTKTFVDKATLFPCEVFIQYKTKRVNGKSSLGVMSLGITMHAEVTLEVNGEQEEQAIEELGELLTRFYD
jgi:phosphocarrier protein HPr